MGARDVIDQFGTWALVRLLLALLVFLILHLARLPLVLLAWALEWGMTGVDRLITAGITQPESTRPRREPLRPHVWR